MKLIKVVKKVKGEEIREKGVDTVVEIMVL